MTVAADLLKQKKEMSNIEWSALLITPSPTESDILSTPESKEGEETWLTSETWCKLKHLQVQMPVPYQGLKKHVRNNLVLWGTLSRNWFKTENKEGGKYLSEGAAREWSTVAIVNSVLLLDSYFNVFYRVTPFKQAQTVHT